MRYGVISVSPDESVSRVMRLMTRHRVRHMPVLRDGELAGIISIGDVVVPKNSVRRGVAFKARVRAMGIRDRPTSFRSPWQNGYVERLIGSIRRECTDHLLVFNDEHLRRILAKRGALAGLVDKEVIGGS